VRLKPTKAQASAIERAREALPGSVTLVAPTGSGKSSVLGPEIARGYLERGLRVLWLTPGPSTAIAAFESLYRVGFNDLRLIASGFEQCSPSATCVIASLWTLHAARKRPALYWPLFDLDPLDSLAPDVVLWDEAHRLTGPIAREVRARFPGASHVNLTATPWRGSQPMPREVLGRSVLADDPEALTAAGLIAPARVICPPPDTLARTVNAHAGRRRGFVFCATQARARDAAAELTAAGWSVEVMLGGMAPLKRRSVFSDLNTGRIDFVVGVGCFVEAIDLAKISVAVLDYAPTSRVKWFQLLGRIRRMRRAPGPAKLALVIDPHRAVVRHGLPNDVMESRTNGITICEKCLSAKRGACAFHHLHKNEPLLESFSTAAVAAMDAATKQSE